MHERTRRRLCRIGFICLVLLPTCLVIATALTVNSSAYTSWRKTQWEEKLGRLLGLDVSVQSLANPQRRLTRLHGVQMRDVGSEQIRVKIRSIDIDSSDHQLMITLAQPEIDWSPPVAWHQLLEQQVLTRWTPQDRPVQLASRELTIKEAESARSLYNVRCKISASRTAVQCDAQFRVSGDAPSAVRLQWSRDRQGAKPATRLRLATGGGMVDCRTAGGIWPGVLCLGETAQLEGTGQAVHDEQGWHGQFVGRLHGVDLDHLITDRFPHKLSGLASVDFRHLDFGHGRVIEAVGFIRCREGGVISRSLLASLADALALERAGSWTSSQQPLWEYEELALEFQLDERILIARGRCGGESGILLRAASEPLLLESRQSEVVPVALVRALVPETIMAVPATRETEWLIGVLPLPSLIRPPAARPAYVPLRLAR